MSSDVTQLEYRKNPRPTTSWLLQLFQSEFFSPWMAIQYLHRYPDSIGTQKYLCDRLSEFETNSLEHYLPQILHLAVTRPKSPAIESLILEQCRTSTQFAVLTWWLLRAYMAETPSGESSNLCKRMLTRIHDQFLPESERYNEGISRRLSRSDDQSPTSTATPEFKSPSPTIGGLLIGMTSALMGFASKPCAELGEELARLESGKIGDTMGAHSRYGGRRDFASQGLDSPSGQSERSLGDEEETHGMLTKENPRSLKSKGHPQARPGRTTSLRNYRFRRRTMDVGSDSDTDLGDVTSGFPLGKADDLTLIKKAHMSTSVGHGSPSPPEGILIPTDTDEPEGPKSAVNLRRRPSLLPDEIVSETDARSPSSPLSPPTFEEFYEGKAFTFSNFISNHSTQGNGPSSTGEADSEEKLVNDSMFEGDLGVSPLMTPSKPPAQKIKGIDQQSELRLRIEPSMEVQAANTLRSYYRFYTALSFFHHLSDISERLVRVPRHARQSALAAELTLLNHNLPAPVTLPFWNSTPSKVVRVSPEEAVVLNSAERVPYLVLIETVREDAIPSASASGCRSALSNPFRRNSNELSQVTSAMPHLLGITESETTQDLEDSFDTPPVNIEAASVETAFQQKMRTAAVMLAQLDFWEKQSGPKGTKRRLVRPPGTPAKDSSVINTDVIRNKVLQEMMALEESRLAEQARIAADVASYGRRPSMARRGSVTRRPSTLVLDKDDPSSAAFQETFEAKTERIRKKSPFGRDNAYDGWQLNSLIVKSGADLRQEQLACQLIQEIRNIWQENGINIWVYPFRVLVTSLTSGIVETVPNTISFHSLKKTGLKSRIKKNGALALRDRMSFPLFEYFVTHFGTTDSARFKVARENFARSLAGYSLITYFLNLKDRHNGNILLDITTGHMVHIDFGFMFTNAPGNVGFETAPFKFTAEYMDILGTEGYDLFRELLRAGFMAVRRSYERVTSLIQTMESCSRLPCFGGVEAKEEDLQYDDNAWSPDHLFWNARRERSIQRGRRIGAGGKISSSTQQTMSTPSSEEDGNIVQSQSDLVLADADTDRSKSRDRQSTADHLKTPLRRAPKSRSATALDMIGMSGAPEQLPGRKGSAQTSNKKAMTSKPATAANPSQATPAESQTVTQSAQERFLLKLSDSQVYEQIDQMITQSLGNVFTRLYDSFQYYSNGILI